MAVVQVLSTEYHIDDKLKHRWDKIREGKLALADEDRVYVVDGREGTGKSWFAIQQAAYIDPTFLEDITKRITFSPESTLEAIRNIRSTESTTKCIVFDEAFRGLSSRAALSKINKQIIQTLMECRQQHLVLFIVLPSFFMLDLYPAVSRSNALIHIAKKKGTKQRSFHVYNYSKKAKLYNIGLKKGWNYNLYTAFKGRFPNIFPGGDNYMKQYLEIKQKALRESHVITDKVSKDEEDKNNRVAIVLQAYQEDTGKTLEDISKKVTSLGWKVNRQGISYYIGKPRKIGNFA